MKSLSAFTWVGPFSKLRSSLSFEIPETVHFMVDIYVYMCIYIYISTLGYWGYKLSLKTIRLTVDGSISIYHGVDKPTSGQTLRPSASLLRKWCPEIESKKIGFHWQKRWLNQVKIDGWQWVGWNLPCDRKMGNPMPSIIPLANCFGVSLNYS